MEVDQMSFSPKGMESGNTNGGTIIGGGGGGAEDEAPAAAFVAAFWAVSFAIFHGKRGI